MCEPTHQPSIGAAAACRAGTSSTGSSSSSARGGSRWVGVRAVASSLVISRMHMASLDALTAAAAAAVPVVAAGGCEDSCKHVAECV